MSENLTVERPAVEVSSSVTPAPAAPSLIPNVNRAQVSSVIGRAMAMLTRPAETWIEIAAEPGGLKEAFVPYAVLMALIPAVAHLVAGFLFSGYLALAMGSFGAAAGSMAFVVSAGQSFIATLAGFLIGGKIMELLAPNFGAKADWTRSCRVLIYSSTPWMLASVASIVPLLGWLVTWAASLWSLMLAYQGYQIVLKKK